MVDHRAKAKLVLTFLNIDGLAGFSVDNQSRHHQSSFDRAKGLQETFLGKKKQRICIYSVIGHSVRNRSPAMRA